MLFSDRTIEIIKEKMMENDKSCRWFITRGLHTALPPSDKVDFKTKGIVGGRDSS